MTSKGVAFRHPDRRDQTSTSMLEVLVTVFPATTLQTCIVHPIRYSFDYACWKGRRRLAAVIHPIYTAPSAEAAQAELDAFAEGPWGLNFPTEEAPTKLIWLALRNVTADRGRATHEWQATMNWFAVPDEDRFVRPSA